MLSYALMASQTFSLPDGISSLESLIAKAIFDALRVEQGALVQGNPAEADSTLIDGSFDLRLVAKAVLNALRLHGYGIGHDRMPPSLHSG